MHGSTSTLLCQLRSVVGVMLLAMVEGMGIGWASPAISKMETPGEAPFLAVDDEASLIVSIFDVGIMLGSWCSTFVFTIAGRRQTVMVGPISLALCVVLTYIGTSSEMLMVARVLAGAGYGITLSFSFIYIGEVTTAALRGPVILATTLLVPVGQLLAFLIGSNVDWAWQSLYPAPFIVAMTVCIIFLMVESPFYYAMRGQSEQMEQCLRRLRVGVPEQAILDEAAAIERNVQRQREDAASWRETFAAPGVKKAALIVFVESGSLAMVGVTTVLAYTQQIFAASRSDLLDATWASVLVVVVQIIMIGVAMILIERLGRRVQLSMAALGTTLSLLLLTAYFACLEVYGMDLSSWKWVPLVAVALYIGAAGSGLSTVPQVLMSELLSQRAKAFVAPLCMTYMALSSFGITFAFLPIGKRSGFWGPFAFFTCTNALIGLFTLALVPETKGKTLSEVQDMLRGQKATKHPL